jgi:hypothetical protein
LTPVTPTTLYAGTWGHGVFSMRQQVEVGTVYLPFVARN